MTWPIRGVGALFATGSLLVAAASAADVRVGERRELLVDGKPFFPIFVWVQPPHLFDFHKGLGINTMMGEGAKSGVSTRQFLDACKAKGLWGIVHATERNLAVRNHPALLTWMFGDEPDLRARLAYERPVKTPRGDDGSLNVWWEGEAPGQTNIPPAKWMDLKHNYLSERRWLAAEAEKIDKEHPLWAKYQIRVPEAARYRLWAREFSKNWASPAWWRFDDGPWQHTSRELRPVELKRVHRVLSVGWVQYGAVQLAQGKHTFEIKVDEVRTAGRPSREGKEAMVAFDAFLLTTSGKAPLAPPRPPRPRILPSEILREYKSWKQADPDRPIYLNLTAGFLPQYLKYKDPSLYDEYCQATDIIGFDHYPIYGWGRPERVPEVAQAVRKLREHARDRIPVWAILETTNGGQWVSEKMRPPHPYEIRAEVWMAIINGATGIGYFPHAWKPRYTWCRVPEANQTELRRLNGQISRLAPVILGPPSPRKVTCRAPEGTKVDLTTREHEGRLYVFAVNLERKTLRVSVAVVGLAAGHRIEVVDEGRHLEAAAGRFDDEFTDLAVHIYRFAAPGGSR